MKHILYIMHIDWNWIKQRPQFIAEELSKKYMVDVVYKHTYSNKGYQKNIVKNDNITLSEVYSFPNKLTKISLFKKINDALFAKKVKQLINAKKPEYIYISSPLLLSAIPLNYKGKIIYDCMDDHYALENNIKIRDSILEQEKKLVYRADFVFVSSEHLKNVLINRYKISKFQKIFLIRNGYSGPILNVNKLNDKSQKKESLTITYIGTISSWFNFDILLESLKDFKNINYELIGPVDHSREVLLPDNANIKFVGTVEHSELYSAIQNSDVLIMPFKVNDVIESVDPVKLYEYINFDKNIISVYYDEIQRFKNFVYFYNNYEDLKNILNNLLESNKLKYTPSQRKDFLEKNSWKSRVNKIIKIID